MSTTKLQAGALFYAVGVSVVIAMTAASVLLCADLNSRLYLKDKINFNVKNNSVSGIAAALQFTETGSYDIDLFHQRKDSVLLTIKPWGVYNLCISEAHTGNVKAKRCALLGNTCNKSDDYALWLADMDRPLYLCGNTRIKGRAYLPKSGVERAYIEGSSYNGSQLIYGSVLNSARFPVRQGPYVDERMNSLFNISADDSVLQGFEMNAYDSIINDFSQATTVVTLRTPYTLKNVTLINNIKIISVHRVTIESSELRFVQIIAPEIVVRAGSYTGVQFIARDSIHIDSAVHIAYPSAIVLNAKQSNTGTADIYIGKDAIVESDIIAIRPEAIFQRDIRVNISTGCILYGRLFSSHTIDMKGQLCGSMCCSAISLKTNSAQYSNHLLNVTIDNNSFSSEYVSSIYFNPQTDSRGIAAWLD